MYAIGILNPATGVEYGNNCRNGVGKQGRLLCKYVRDFLARVFPEDLEIIDEKEAPNRAKFGKKECLGGERNFITRSYFFSKNYCNASHIDFRDISNSIIIWSEDIPNRAQKWRFIFPNISINGSDGLVVIIRNGLSLSFDGKVIRHCTAKCDPGENNNVYGCAFASTTSGSAGNKGKRLAKKNKK